MKFATPDYTDTYSGTYWYASQASQAGLAAPKLPQPQWQVDFIDIAAPLSARCSSVGTAIRKAWILALAEHVRECWIRVAGQKQWVKRNSSHHILDICHGEAHCVDALRCSKDKEGPQVWYPAHRNTAYLSMYSNILWYTTYICVYTAIYYDYQCVCSPSPSMEIFFCGHHNYHAAGILLHWHRKALNQPVNLAKASAFLSLQALHKLADRLFHAVCICYFMKLLSSGHGLGSPSSSEGPMSISSQTWRGWPTSPINASRRAPRNPAKKSRFYGIYYDKLACTCHISSYIAISWQNQLYPSICSYILVYHCIYIYIQVQTSIYL